MLLALDSKLQCSLLIKYNHYINLYKCKAEGS